MRHRADEQEGSRPPCWKCSCQGSSAQGTACAKALCTLEDPKGEEWVGADTFQARSLFLS